MDRGAWQATVHGVAKSRTRLKLLSMHAFCILCIFVQYLYSYMYYKEGLCMCLIIQINSHVLMLRFRKDSHCAQDTLMHHCESL